MVKKSLTEEKAQRVVSEIMSAGSSADCIDEFWTQAADRLLMSCVTYILDFLPPEKHSLSEVNNMLDKGFRSVSGVDKTGVFSGTELGEMFQKAVQEKPAAVCIKYYEQLSFTGSQTRKDILQHSKWLVGFCIKKQAERGHANE